MTDAQALANSLALENYLKVRQEKQQRNYDRYYSNGIRQDEIHNLYGQPLAYWFNALEEDQGTIPVLNGIKNAIDTVVSKFVTTKVRPFANPIDGTYNTRKAAHQVQIALDHIYETQKVHQKGGMILRDSLMMEVGHFWVDEEEMLVKKVSPWEVFWDPAQYHYGKVSCYKLKFRQYPVSALIEKGKITQSDPLYKGWKMNPLAVVAYNIHYDLTDGWRRDIVNGRVIKKTKINFKIPSVTFLYYNPPVKGIFTTSLADDLFTLQTQVDTISFRIHAAIERNPANTIFVPKGSNIKPSMVSNEIGVVVETAPAPNGMLPVTVSTPHPIDPMYKDLLEYFLDKQLQMSGISKMTAQAVKPAGDVSGKAMDTLEDMETERWNVVLQNVIQNYMDLKDIIIAVMPENERILPKEDGRSAMTYGQLRKEIDKIHIQFAPASSLSKDPKTKLEQIYILDQMGLVNPTMKASLLEFPDLEGAYSIATASYEYCQTIIQRAVEEDTYDFYGIVDLNQLFAEIQNALMRFDSAGESQNVLDRLVKLMKMVKVEIDKAASGQAPPPGPPPVAPPAPIGGQPVGQPQGVPTIPPPQGGQ